MDHVSEVYLVMAAVWRSYSRLVEKFPWSSTILQVVGVEGLRGWWGWWLGLRGW